MTATFFPLPPREAESGEGRGGGRSLGTNLCARGDTPTPTLPTLRSLRSRGGRGLAVALIAVATVAAAPGPNATEFNALRTVKGEKCPPLRNLSCAVLGDPTEYKCSYQERFKGKPWTTSVALVGKTATGWDWLDGGPRCSSLPQH